MSRGQGVVAGEGADVLLGSAGLDDGEIAELVRAMLGDPSAQLPRWRVEPVNYRFGSPTTAGLVRIRGTAAGATGQQPWSLFVKLLRSYRHWPLLHMLPPPQQEEALSTSVWRYEADVYAAGLGDALPTGLRLPVVHRIKDLGAERIALVLEDVAADHTPWDAPCFAHAAHLLARLAVRLTRLDALPVAGSRIPGEVTGRYYTSRLLNAAIPALSADPVWKHPAMASADRRLRPDLVELARRVPTILEALTRRPQLMMHGDASPQNLLRPAAEPGTFVGIDWTMGGLAAVGDDLGQLLVGLAHAGELTPTELPELRDVIAGAYTAGLGAEGVAIDEAAVRYGMDGGLVVRSALTALPLERMNEPLTAELIDLFEARLRLTRYLVDLGLALPL